MAYFSPDADGLGEFGCGADCSCKGCRKTVASDLSEVYIKEKSPPPPRPPAKMGGWFGEPFSAAPRVAVTPRQPWMRPFKALTGYAPQRWWRNQARQIQRTSAHEFAGYGIAAKLVELGPAVLETVKTLIGGSGEFVCESSLTNAEHEKTPPEQTFISCTRKLLIEAFIPNLMVPPDIAKKRHLFAAKFWLKLSYEYNGNDLKNVHVLPLVAESSMPRKSQFKISFVSPASQRQPDPVAEVPFKIHGTWKLLGVFTDTTVSFWGDLSVRADGFATVQNFESEKKYVWFVGMAPYPLHACPIKLPYRPIPAKTPVRKHFSLIPPILFPFNKATVSPNESQRIREWIKSWPVTTREKIARGEITITIEGFASRPGGEYSESNVRLAKDRAAAVVNILKDPLGSLATPKFDVRSYGAWMRNLPRLFDVSQWLQRFFDPNKYDQAVVIRFEDVE